MDRDKKRLVINKDEAEQVRTIFDLYLQQRGMIPVCQELNRRGWTTKTITYKNGRHKEGVPWNKARLYDILVNVTYIGKVRHRGQIYPGEQDAIVDKRVFQEVQTLLQLNSQNGGADTRNKHGALLRGLLKCGHCGAAMAHTYTQPARRGEKGNRLYRYYMCLTKMKRGRDACPTPTLPAQEIEDFVVEQIKTLARDPELQRQVFEEAGKQQQKQVAQLESERKRLQRQLQARKEEGKRLTMALSSRAGMLARANGDSPTILKRITEVEAASSTITARISELDREIAASHHNIDFGHLKAALTEFDAIWDVLMLHEKGRLINSVIERVVGTGTGDVHVEFRRYRPFGPDSPRQTSG